MSKQGINFGVGVILGLSVPLLLNQLATAQTATTVQDIPISQYNGWQAFFLGIVQGITEFLPISSTAHLKVIPVVLGWGDPGVTYTAIIQLGSIAAVIWYFWKDLAQITKGMFKAVRRKDYYSLEFRLAMGIILGTLPILFFGVLLKLLVQDIDHSALRSMTVIGCASIVMSLLLALAEKMGTHKRGYENLKIQDGIFMGLAQALALVPGVSRSGSTMTAGLFVDLERSTAARFSFLLGIPAITLAGLVELKDVVDQTISQTAIFPLVVGVISSAVFSYLAIAGLIRFLQKQSNWVFVFYRLFFGIAILLGVMMGKLS
ncbi:undecaprenyl-diphosphatase [Aphanothece hegewaldii CCALA 016]|uniref:Undecaprenyl-diphosphatase n=1 Tax=Aphanothece hegewaldii CCALA 016 TaxID=2107694 RepID=A0A2T1LRZ0_9CHRO|nr:undecaprenyl-diphosphate phosphatase [Aphanothece hegewaldii]PSF32009.1 undecaprenyl-diphosphatase [Aphanothece hegewaldii CCALA 016]